MRKGIPAMSFSRVSGEISFQAKSNCFSSIFMLVARSIESSLLFKIAQRFSMGFKSGELGGHISLVQNPGILLFSHSWLLFEVCAGAPSCWKIALDLSGNNSLSRLKSHWKPLGYFKKQAGFNGTCNQHKYARKTVTFGLERNLTGYSRETHRRDSLSH